jgi:membrane protein involved in colicin uptake
MSEEDRQPTTESEVRGAELRENLALTDARRAEEEVAKAHEATEKARQEEEKAARKEQEAREKAERVHAEADRARAAADDARGSVSGASVASPGVGTTTEPDAQAAAAGPAFPGADRLPEAAQRTEVLVGAAFVGSFVLARVLKRLFD